MKTLVIHPKDKTTDFLNPIYQNIPDKTVITGGIDQESLNQLIEDHDRILFMGHGSPHGLFTVGQFNTKSSYIVGDNAVKALKNKDNVLYLWCNADKFVNHHKLKGLYSGMFISEMFEAIYCNVNANINEVNESNELFANLLGEQLITDKPIIEIHNTVKISYDKLAEFNPVAKYNNKRWYHA